MHITKDAAVNRWMKRSCGEKLPRQGTKECRERVPGRQSQIFPDDAKTSGWRKYPGKRSASIASMPETIQNVYEDRTVSWP
jgi:hypothetical protein